MTGKGSDLFMKLVDDRGAIIGLVVFMMVVLMGFAALAVDVGHLYMVRNELQNAADAGALAGASVLYSDNATRVKSDANQVAFDAATSNNVTIFPGGWSAVQVDWTPGTNTGGVERGHYNYATGEFTRNDALEPVNLLSGTEATLNSDTYFVNAVRVITRTSTGSLFGRFLGISTSDLFAEAIAYIGFAKELNPRDVDQPIAVCQEWLYPSDSSRNPCNNYPNNSYWVVPDNTDRVARWITLDQDPQHDMSCSETLDGNPQVSSFDNSMVISMMHSNLPALQDFRQLWHGDSLLLGRCARNDLDHDPTRIRESFIDSDNDGVPDRPWILTLPVIDCANTYSMPPLGRVEVAIIWITPSSNVCYDAPSIMYDEPAGPSAWTYGGLVLECSNQCSASVEECRWCSFAQHFRFRDYFGPSTYLYNCHDSGLQNVMFIKPVCEDDDGDGTYLPVRPTTGRTGSSIYPMNPTGVRGQLAKYPVLVK